MVAERYVERPASAISIESYAMTFSSASPRHNFVGTPKLADRMEKPRASSILSKHKGGGRKPRTKVGLNLDAGGVAEHKFMPEAFRHEANGWQMQYIDLQSRIASLFNCYTMSDVIFQVEVHSIPAHKFILGSASPVFYRQLYEENHAPMFLGGGASWADGRHTTLRIVDVPHLAFFEFLQFIYTDNVNITLDNVLQLFFLADTYKVHGLIGKCLDFLRAQVLPGSVLRVLAILRALLTKAVMMCWRDQVVQRRSLARFRQMSLAERRALRDDVGETSSMGGRSLPGSRRGSTCSVMTTRSVARSCSAMSMDSSRGYRDDDEMSDDVVMSSCFLDNDARRVLQKMETGIAGSMVDTRIAHFVEELSGKCWKCIQEHTEAVLLCADMLEQEVRLLRQILRIETCSVPEIAFFRAAHEWAFRQCKKLGHEPTPEVKRAMLGLETLLLVRFPAMTLEQVEWEVIPSGLLEYEDVRQLLYYFTERSPGDLVTRFSTEPRNNRTLGKKDPADAEALGRTCYLYTPTMHDALDGMLAGELLKVFLKHGLDRPSDGGSATPVPAAARLPPIASTASIASSAGAGPATNAAAASQTVPPAGDLIWPVRPPGQPRGSPFRMHGRKPPAEMVMGQRVAASELYVDHPENELATRRPQARDFQRLAPGLYRFRGDRLLELWLETGEPMILDHGPWPELASLPSSPPCDEPAAAALRDALGLGQALPIGRGSPLASFLNQP